MKVARRFWRDLSHRQNQWLLSSSNRVKFRPSHLTRSIIQSQNNLEITSSITYLSGKRERAIDVKQEELLVWAIFESRGNHWLAKGCKESRKLDVKSLIATRSPVSAAADPFAYDPAWLGTFHFSYYSLSYLTTRFPALRAHVSALVTPNVSISRLLTSCGTYPNSNAAESYQRSIPALKACITWTSWDCCT